MITDSQAGIFKSFSIPMVSVIAVNSWLLGRENNDARSRIFYIFVLHNPIYDLLLETLLLLPQKDISES